MHEEPICEPVVKQGVGSNAIQQLRRLAGEKQLSSPVLRSWYRAFVQAYAEYKEEPTWELRDILHHSCQTILQLATEATDLTSDPRLVRIVLAYLRMFRNIKPLLSYCEQHRIGAESALFYLQVGIHYEFDQRDIDAALCYYQRGRHLDPNNSLLERSCLRLSRELKRDLELCTKGEDLEYPQISDVSFEEQRLLDIHVFFHRQLIARKQVEPLNPYSQLANDPHILSRMVYALTPRSDIILYTARQTQNSDSAMLTGLVEPYHIPRSFYFDIVCVAPTLRQRNIILTFIDEIDEFPTNPAQNDTIAVISTRSVTPVIQKAQLTDGSAKFKTFFESSMQATELNTNATIVLTLTACLGSGAFGKVFRADSISSMRPDIVTPVAVKFFLRKKDSMTFDLDSLSRCLISTSFLREIYALGVLTLRLIDSVQECLFTRLISAIVDNRGIGAVVLEYIPGPTLYDLCKSRYGQTAAGMPCLPEGVILWFIYCMIRTVRAIHRAHLVHTDIKIDNWIVTLMEGCKTDAFPDADEDFSEPLLTPICCDFGKSIDTTLFTCDDTPVYFVAGSLSVVTPCPIVHARWLYEADYSGIASCIYYMYIGQSLRKEDVHLYAHGTVTSVSVRFEAKRYWEHAMLAVSLMNELLSYTNDKMASYIKQAEHAYAFETGLLDKLRPHLRFQEVAEFSRQFAQTHPKAGVWRTS